MCGFEARPGHGPVVEFGRHTSLRTRRLVHGSSSLPRPTNYAPVARVPSGRGRGGSLKTSVNMQVRFQPGVLLGSRVTHPNRTATVAASKTAIRGSIPRGCAMWEMPKWSRRLSAKQFLPGSSPGSHSIGGRKATATLSGPKTSAPGRTRMEVRLLRPPPSH